MDKESKKQIERLTNLLALERQVSDQLFDALVNGGMERQFQALAFHEHSRNGFLYHGVVVGESPEAKPKKQATRAKRSPNHPMTYRWGNAERIAFEKWKKKLEQQDNQQEEE